jgi:SAM-dependent methyltransferase
LKKYPFDPYDLYQASVQSPEIDVRFFLKLYKQYYGNLAKSFREDFCGTHALCCEWVKLGPKNKAWGLDLDPQALMWGLAHNQSQLEENQKQRIFIFQGNVLTTKIVRTDIVAALNFSYFVFKSRDQLSQYFKNVRKTIKKKGLFIIDVFGGDQCLGPITDVRKLKGFEYHWEQKGFDVLSHFAHFAIHFKYKNKIYRNVFQYDWRLWSIPELTEILKEVGFRWVDCYWEGTNKKGYGNGKFSKVTKAESCESWFAYLVARP